MFEIFNTPLRHQVGTITVTGWNQAKTMLHLELKRLTDYHRQNISFLPNQHPIVRMLTSLKIPNGDLNTVALEISNSFNNQMTGLGIGSPYGRPDFSMNSWFYNNRTYEILIQDTSIFDADEVYLNWRDATPIKVLHHDFNDMSLAIPNGKYQYNGNPGFAVITINPAMLAIQYKGYLDWSLKSGAKEIKAPAIYASQYPIFNMLFTQLDISFRNRVIDTFVGRPLSPFKPTYSMAVNNPTSHVDGAIASIIQGISSQPFKFDKVLELIPSIMAVSQRDITPFPRNAVTYSTKWIYDVARAPLLDFLVHYGRLYPNYMNLDYLNTIRRDILEMEMDKSIPNNVSKAVRVPLESLKQLTSVV